MSSHPHTGPNGCEMFNRRCTQMHADKVRARGRDLRGRAIFHASYPACICICG